VDPLSLSLWLASGAVGIGATAAALRARFAREARAWARAEKAHARSIAHAPDGVLVKLTGALVLGDDCLTSPLSGRVCAGFRALVEPVRGPRLAEEARFASFVLDDGTGKVRVDPARAIVDVTLDHVWHARTLDAEDLFDLELFLATHVDAATLPSEGRATLVYREGTLSPGETVTVVGVLSLPPHEERSPYRDASRERVVGGAADAPLLVSDRLHFA
jgi:hypothetical protein